MVWSAQRSRFFFTTTGRPSAVMIASNVPEGMATSHTAFPVPVMLVCFVGGSGLMATLSGLQGLPGRQSFQLAVGAKWKAVACPTRRQSERAGKKRENMV